jgi:hypothetical protein
MDLVAEVALAAAWAVVLAASVCCCGRALPLLLQKCIANIRLRHQAPALDGAWEKDKGIRVNAVAT